MVGKMQQYLLKFYVWICHIVLDIFVTSTLTILYLSSLSSLYSENSRQESTVYILFFCTKTLIIGQAKNNSFSILWTIMFQTSRASFVNSWQILLLNSHYDKLWLSQTMKKCANSSPRKISIQVSEFKVREVCSKISTAII